MRRILARLFLALTVASLIGGPLAPSAEAHARCDGADHTHRHITWRGIHTDHWDFLRVHSIPENAYQNVYRIREHGRIVFSPRCGEPLRWSRYGPF
jgi:hypothetical protein